MRQAIFDSISAHRAQRFIDGCEHEIGGQLGVVRVDRRGVDRDGQPTDQPIDDDDNAGSALVWT